MGHVRIKESEMRGRGQGADGAKICNDFHRDAYGMLEPFEMLSAIIHSINETYLAKPVL